MPHSMTGFGSHRTEADGYAARVEARSVNHRFLDVSVRIGRGYGALQEPITARVAQRLQRGRVEIDAQIAVTFGQGSEAAGRPAAETVRIDWQALATYVAAARSLDDRLRAAGLAETRPASAAEWLALPGVASAAEGAVDSAAAWPVLAAALEQALDALVEMRRREGERLARELNRYLDDLAGFITQIDGRRQTIFDEQRRRLIRRLGALAPELEVDPARLEQEVVLAAERADVEEEIVRLGSHLSAFRAALGADGPVGRRLDFLVQELGREVNTIGSKTNDAEISGLVVEAKAALEKLREQVQNLE